MIVAIVEYLDLAYRRSELHAMREKNMRADARQNRAVLLDAASAVFAREGFDAPLEMVATQAGVSRTTLYRNFADREALGFAIFERYILELEELSRTLLERVDGFATLLEALVEQSVESAGLADALQRRTDVVDQLTKLRHRVIDLMMPSLRTAQDAGLLDPQLDRLDVDIALRMLWSSVTEAPPDMRRTRAVRALAILLSGLSARPDGRGLQH